MFKKLTLYVVRVDRHDGRPVDSTPCEDCVRTIRLLNLKRVVYIDADGMVAASKPEALGDGVQCAGKRFMWRAGIIGESQPSQSGM